MALVHTELHSIDKFEIKLFEHFITLLHFIRTRSGLWISIQRNLLSLKLFSSFHKKLWAPFTSFPRLIFLFTFRLYLCVLQRIFSWLYLCCVSRWVTRTIHIRSLFFIAYESDSHSQAIKYGNVHIKYTKFSIFFKILCLYNVSMYVFITVSLVYYIVIVDFRRQTQEIYATFDQKQWTLNASLQIELIEKKWLKGKEKYRNYDRLSSLLSLWWRVVWCFDFNPFEFQTHTHTHNHYNEVVSHVMSIFESAQYIKSSKIISFLVIWVLSRWEIDPLNIRRTISHQNMGFLLASQRTLYPWVALKVSDVWWEIV